VVVSAAQNGHGHAADLSRLFFSTRYPAAERLRERHRAASRSTAIPPARAISRRPNVLELVTLGPPPVIQQAPGHLPPIPRDNPFIQPFNLSVPGITVAQALSLHPTLTPPSNPDPVQGWATIVLTTDFLGGLFSLDGIHPTNTEYGIIANDFIDAMNQSLRTGIPDADIAASDPLVFSSNPMLSAKSARLPHPPSACVAPQAIGNPATPLPAHALTLSAKQEDNLDDQNDHHHQLQKERPALMEFIDHRFI
jgi:hypothetical protein